MRAFAISSLMPLGVALSASLFEFLLGMIDEALCLIQERSIQYTMDGHLRTPDSHHSPGSAE